MIERIKRIAILLTLCLLAISLNHNAFALDRRELARVRNPWTGNNDYVRGDDSTFENLSVGEYIHIGDEAYIFEDELNNLTLYDANNGEATLSDLLSGSGSGDSLWVIDGTTVKLKPSVISNSVYVTSLTSDGMIYTNSVTSDTITSNDLSIIDTIQIGDDVYIVDDSGDLTFTDSSNTAVTLTSLLTPASEWTDYGSYLEPTDSGKDINIDGELTAGDTTLGNATVTTLASNGNITLGTYDLIMTGDVATTDNRVDNAYIDNLYASKLGDNLSANTYTITGLAEPSNNTDAATKSYVDNLALYGTSWVNVVIRFSIEGDAGQTLGNRYIASADGSTWTEDNIYEWNGTAWDETEATTGMTCQVTYAPTLPRYYNYNGTDWVSMGSGVDHNATTGLQGGNGTDQMYHATEAEHNNWFIKNNDDSDDIIEGSTNEFYSDAKVDSQVQDSASDYTIQGDWVFNNNITSANTPTDDNHLTRKLYVDNLVEGRSYREAVLDKDLSDPPVSPDDGDRYIVAAGSAAWYDIDWDYRQKITIDSSMWSDSHSDFPLMVNLTDNSNTLFTNCQSDGDDIVFTTSDKETKIPHEIEYLNTASGSRQLIAYLKTDLTASTDLEVYMYYGNSTCGNQQQVSAVWDSDYHVVQHLNEASGTFYDSTSEDNDGVQTGGVTYRTSGKVGYATSFDGSNDIITLPSSNAITGDNLQALTATHWFKHTATNNSYMFSFKRSSSASTLFATQANNVSTKAGFLFRNNADTAHKWLNSTDVVNDGNWHHVAAVLDSGTWTLYIDGIADGTNSEGMQSVTGNTYPATIGGFSATSNLYNGAIDEVRFSRTARSADWVVTEYKNQNAPGTYQTFSSQETPGSGGDWDGHVNDITEWDTIDWSFEEPETGWTLYVVDEEVQYTWNGSAWISAGGSGVSVHNDTTGKQGGTTDEYYHLEQGEHTELTDWLDDVTLSSNGNVNLGSGEFDTTGSLTFDDAIATGIVQTAQVLANGSGSHPSGIGYYVELYMNGNIGRILPYNGSSYCDLAIGDWNGGDPNIMLKTGGNVGINKGSPLAKLHVAGDAIIDTDLTVDNKVYTDELLINNDLTVDGSIYAGGNYYGENSLLIGNFGDGNGIGLNYNGYDDFGIETHNVLFSEFGDIESPIAFGEIHQCTISPTETNDDIIYSMYFQTEYTSEFDSNFFVGVINNMLKSGTGDINLMYGASHAAEIANTGVVNTAVGMDCNVINGLDDVDNGGDLTQGYGVNSSIVMGTLSGDVGQFHNFRANQSVENGTLDKLYNFSARGNAYAGTVNEHYGFYAEQFASDGATISYPLYIDGGTSYFGGNVGIGTTSPANTLDVDGTARIVTDAGNSISTTDSALSVLGSIPRIDFESPGFALGDKFGAIGQALVIEETGVNGDYPGVRIVGEDFISTFYVGNIELLTESGVLNINANNGIYFSNDNDDIAVFDEVGNFDLPANLYIGGGVVNHTSRYTTTQTLDDSDNVVFCDTDGGAWTLTLPAGVEGRHYKIIQCGSSGNDLTIDAIGTEKVYGELTQTIPDGSVIDLHYNSTEGWW